MGQEALTRLGDYQCEGQMNIEEYLWNIGYYMPLPIGDEN